MLLWLVEGFLLEVLALLVTWDCGAPAYMFMWSSNLELLQYIKLTSSVWLLADNDISLSSLVTVTQSRSCTSLMSFTFMYVSHVELHLCKKYISKPELDPDRSSDVIVFKTTRAHDVQAFEISRCCSTSLQMRFLLAFITDLWPLYVNSTSMPIADSQNRLATLNVAIYAIYTKNIQCSQLWPWVAHGLLTKSISLKNRPVYTARTHATDTGCKITFRSCDNIIKQLSAYACAHVLARYVLAAEKWHCTL